MTGVREGFRTDFERYFEQINGAKAAPAALGFGISTPEQVRQMKRYADAVIVASAIVRRMAEAPGEAEAVRAAASFVAELKAALDEPAS